jgi:hypothetical protein
VAGVHAAGAVDWRRGSEEGEVPYVLRLLEAHQFHFKDLGLRRGSSGAALLRIRRQLGIIASRLADAQPLAQRPLVRAAGNIIANTLAFEPATNIFHLTLGRELELGWSRSFPEVELVPDALRLQLALQFPAFGDLLSSDSRPFAITLLAGPEIMPPRLSSTRLQWSLALRAGYVLSGGDRFGAGSCSQTRAGQIGGCSRFVAQGALSLGVLQVVRLQLIGAWHPAVSIAEPALWSVSPALGLQLGF